VNGKPNGFKSNKSKLHKNKKATALTALTALKTKTKGIKRHYFHNE
jgi:hypothetical protein